jgi:hypothetical protein
MFLPEMNSSVCCDWYPLLSTYGKIPEGTLMFNVVDEMMADIYQTEVIEESEYPENIDDFLELYEEYKQLKSKYALILLNTSLLKSFYK